MIYPRLLFNFYKNHKTYLYLNIVVFTEGNSHTTLAKSLRDIVVGRRRPTYKSPTNFDRGPRLSKTLCIAANDSQQTTSTKRLPPNV